MNVQAKAQLKYLRMSPQKVRLVVGLIRGLSVVEAKKQLVFSRKRAARPILKLLESAVANSAHNHDMKEDTLKIETIFVNEGSTLRRWMPRAMGRATPLRKRSSHITLILTGEAEEKKVEKEKKEDKKVDDIQESKDEKSEIPKDKEEKTK